MTGITIIDMFITKSIKYCFAFLDYWPNESLKPLSACKYLTLYEKAPEEDEEKELDPAEREKEDIDNDGDDKGKETHDAHKSLDSKEFSTLTTPIHFGKEIFWLRTYSMMTKDALRNWLQSEENGEISSNFADQRGSLVGSVRSLCE
ncbi:MAG: hypothetical protein Q9205_004027 [Flavoplaca limonia]